jgi:hypothetical protein
MYIKSAGVYRRYRLDVGFYVRRLASAAHHQIPSRYINGCSYYFILNTLLAIYLDVSV